MARKRSQPLYPYKLNWKEVPQEVLGKVSNIHDKEEWEKVSHIVVNEDGLKIPVTIDEEDISSSVAYRFI